MGGALRLRSSFVLPRAVVTPERYGALIDFARSVDAAEARAVVVSLPSAR